MGEATKMNTIYKKQLSILVNGNSYLVSNVELTPYGKPIRVQIKRYTYFHDHASQEWWYLDSNCVCYRSPEQVLIDMLVNQYLQITTDKAILE